MEALLVVDIQPETVQPRKAESFIGLRNEIIGSFAPEHVVYIANLRPFARLSEGNSFADGLDVVSENIFFKRMPDAFTNKGLHEWLGEIGADSVRIIGIDGNWCIKATALGALKHGFRVTVIEDAVASANIQRFKERTVPRLKKRGILLSGVNERGCLA